MDSYKKHVNNNKDNRIGRVLSVSISKNRGESKESVRYIDLKENYGIIGDAHAGTQKQVSLLANEEIICINNRYNLNAQPGDFAENITTKGLDLMSFSPGDKIEIGPVLLEVFCIGKSPEEMREHSFSYKGYKLLPKVGLFCNVLRGGRVKPNDLISWSAP